MKNENMYEPTFELAMKSIETPKIVNQEDVAENMTQVYTSVAVAIVMNSTPLIREFLSDITGVDLLGNEEMYDYVTKTLEMNPEKALTFGLAVVAQNGDLGELVDMMREGRMK